MSSVKAVHTLEAAAIERWLVVAGHRHCRPAQVKQFGDRRAYVTRPADDDGMKAGRKTERVLHHLGLEFLSQFSISIGRRSITAPDRQSAHAAA